MPKATIAEQRSRVLTAFALLLSALALQPAYLVVSGYWEAFARWFAFVPGLCFALVMSSTVLAVWVEQTTKNDDIRACARKQIWIFVILVVLGILSAAQASAWLGIQNRWLLGLLDFSAVSAIVAGLVIGGAIFLQAIRSLPKG